MDQTFSTITKSLFDRENSIQVNTRGRFTDFTVSSGHVCDKGEKIEEGNSFILGNQLKSRNVRFIGVTHFNESEEVYGESFTLLEHSRRSLIDCEMDNRYCIA